jgi:putative ABC transport system substrate-binding protein
MRELGYEDKRNVKFESRFAEGHLDRLPMLVGELIDLNPSVIISAATAASLAAKRATRTIPIVMPSSADPVGFGIIASLNRPGGNVTGLANFGELLVSKQFELLHELMPQLSRVGVLINPENILHVPQLKESRAAAAQLRLDASFFEIRTPDELDSTFYLADLALSFRMPAIYGYRECVVEGGLMSYGPNLPASYRRAATYVNKILRGANPADLPVEEPTKIDLAINLKTAKALGLNVPDKLLALADEVIE